MSDLLLDIHAMFWFFWDDPLLSSKAKASIEDPENRKFVSIASCWEASIKAGLKKLKLGAHVAPSSMRRCSRMLRFIGYSLPALRA